MTILRDVLPRFRRAAASILLLTFVFLAPPHSRHSVHAALGDVVPPEVQQLAKLEKRVRACVVQAKNTSSLSDGDRDTLRRLYASAHAKYGLWVTAVTSAFTAGRAKKLEDDQEYDSLSKEAAGAVKDVVEYCVANNLGTPPRAGQVDLPQAEVGVGVWMPPLLTETGVTICTRYAHLPLRKRKSAVGLFEALVGWRSWEDISY